MNFVELIGSSLMLGIRGSSMNQEETRADLEMLKAIHCRGVVLFDHDIAGNHPRNVLNPEQLGGFITDLRNELGSDLVVAIDQEGGQVSRLKQERGFLPSVSAAEFGSWEQIDQDQYAGKHARQLKQLGIDLNLAPCVDLAIEPHSPIIAGKERAFGDDQHTVVRCAGTIIEAHAREGVRCCIKHYPGHGSALLDSHLDMCDVTRSHAAEESEVFSTLIKRFGSSIAIMPGHLIDRKIDDHLPASLSRNHLEQGLRGQMGFDGVIISDSLDMRAIRDHYGEGESAVLAIAAGCDVVLDGLNAPGFREPGAPLRIVDAILRAARAGELADAEERLEASKSRLDRLFSR